uniref:Uncharacterized protein n=1 Tax=Angiostrongylus cantonensis TaxID=6313 RepID=A0A0K0DJT1_ANGCA
MLQLCLSRSGNQYDERLSSRAEQKEMRAAWEAFKSIEDVTTKGYASQAQQAIGKIIPSASHDHDQVSRKKCPEATRDLPPYTWINF